MAAQVSAAISATSATSAGSGRAASFGSILAVISGPCSCDVALQRAGPGHWNPRQWANFAPGSNAQGQAGRRFFGRAFHACPKAPDCRPAPASAACFAGHLRPRAKGGRSSGAKPAALSACRTRFTLATMRGGAWHRFISRRCWRARNAFKPKRQARFVLFESAVQVIDVRQFIKRTHWARPFPSVEKVLPSADLNHRRP